VKSKFKNFVCCMGGHEELVGNYTDNPRYYAIDLVDTGTVTSWDLLACALKYMSHDDVRDMLDANELSPRFADFDEGADHG